jgi:hypothetical protein
MAQGAMKFDGMNITFHLWCDGHSQRTHAMNMEIVNGHLNIASENK